MQVTKKHRNVKYRSIEAWRRKYLPSGKKEEKFFIENNPEEIGATLATTLLKRIQRQLSK